MAQSGNGADSTRSSDKVQALLKAVSTLGEGATIVDRLPVAFRTLMIPAGTVYALYEVPSQTLSPAEVLDFHYRRAVTVMQNESPSSIAEATQCLMDYKSKKLRDKRILGVVGTENAVAALYRERNEVLTDEGLATQTDWLLTNKDPGKAAAINKMILAGIEAAKSERRIPKGRGANKETVGNRAIGDLLA